MGDMNWLMYGGLGNLVRTMAPNYTLSDWQFRGVWGEVQGNLALGRGYCASLGHPEDETGLVYMRARYYEPLTGRFISEDPAQDGVNWYLYADGNPVNRVDDSGKASIGDWIFWGLGMAFAMAALAVMVSYFRHKSEYLLDAPDQMKRLNLAMALSNASVAMFGIAAVGMLTERTLAYIGAGVIAASALIMLMVQSTEVGLKTAASAAVAAAFIYGLIVLGAALSVGAET